MFKVLCLIFAVLTVAGMGWMVNDVRVELKRSSARINEHLPQILENTRETTETLATLSVDLKQLRDLAGVGATPRDKSLVAFADGLLDLVEASGGTIGLKKKVLGRGLKNVLSAKEWVVAARREALWLTFRATSRDELLARLCENKFGSRWFIQIGEAEPIPLVDWLRDHHPE